MANILEYTLSLNDLVSAKLRQIGVNSNIALERFSKLQLQAVKAQDAFSSMGRSVGTLREKLALLRNERDLIPASSISTIRTYNSEIKKLEKEISKLETINGSKFKTAMRNAFQSMPGADFITNPIVAGAGAIAGIVKLGMEAEQTKTSFDVLLGSQQKSSDLLRQLTDYANKTPYGKQEIFEASKMMLQFGISAGSVMPNIKMIGDIAMGDANKMNSLTLAFSQVSSAGKLQGQDLLQMINAGFNPLKEISRTTGESMGSLREKMEKGAISADMVAGAFQSATSKGGIFYGMSDKMSKTIGGQLSTVLDNFKEKALMIFSLIQPLIQPVLDILDKLITWMEIIVTPFTKFITSLKEGNKWSWALAGTLGAVAIAYELISLWLKRSLIMTQAKLILDKAQVFWNVAVTAATTAWTAAQWLLNAAFIASPIGWIVLSVGALVIGIVIAWNKFEKFRAVVITVWNTLKGFGVILKDFVIDRIKGIISGLGSLGSAIYKLFTGDFKGAWAAAKQGVKDLSGFSAAQKAVSSGSNLLGGVQDNYNFNLAQDRATRKAEKIMNSPAQDAAIKLVRIPGRDNGTGDGKGKGNGSGKTVTDTISTGGTKNSSVIIQFRNLVENIIIDGTLKDKRADIEKEVTQAMQRVLGMVAATS